MCATFWPKKPIMGGLVQIKSDTHVAWMGGMLNLDWTDLKIRTSDPQQSSQICPMLDNSSSMNRVNVKFSKEKGDLFSFQCKVLWHFQDTGMDTNTYLKDLGDPAKMVNLLMDHTQFTQAYVKMPSKSSTNCTTPVIIQMIVEPAMHSWTALTQPSIHTLRLISLTTSVSSLSGCK